MKKLFLLIPVLVLSLTIKADPIPVSPGTNAIQTAIASASANAVLELSSGMYTEAGNFAISKSITIQAAAGATPVIAMKSYIRIEGENTQVTITGVKFDGALNTATDHCIRSYDEKAGKTLTLDKCEFTNYPNYVIYAHRGDRCMEAMTIRNCYFHNNAKYAIFIGYDSSHGANQACNSLTVENSTFADCPNEYSMIYFTGPDDADAALVVNHCTFYKYNSDAIQWLKSSNVTITNSIFALPSSLYCYAVRCAGGTIDHCLNYNSSRGYSVASTDDITGNPYFVNTNADNYDFTPASFSNARNAGTDSKNLGDLRWNSDDSAHPTTINITAGTGVIKAAVEAAWSGDEIVLATGTYNESASIALNKDITLKAADGATPTVVPVNSLAISSGVDVTIQGLKFDATSITGDLISVSDATAGNKLTLEDCELCNTGSNRAIYAGSSAHFDACVINNCYFHNGNNSAICIAAGSTSHVCDRIEITNSTFANYSGFATALIQIASKGSNFAENPADDQEIVVDHCTFYNFTKTADNTYGFIDSRKSANVTLSNCIIANPTAQSSLPSGTYNPKASQLYGGTITNCLIYNVPNHRTDAVTPANPIEADPLFTDAANGDYTLKGNYITGEVSPARGAATGKSDLGDPRWYTEAVYPTTDFSGMGYDFEAVDASLSGNILLETGGPKDPYLRYYHAYDPGTAEWIIKVTRPCYVVAIVNMADNTWNYDSSDAERKYFQNHKHLFAVEIFDSENNSVGSVADVNDNDGDGHDTPYPTFPLPESIYIPEAGVYTVRLSNNRHESRCGVASVTLKYTGGLTIAIPDTLKPIDALLSAKAFVDQTGAVDSIKFSTTNSDVPNQWAKWKISVPKDGTYSFAAHVKSSNRHNYRLTIKSADESSTIATFYGPNDNSGERVITFDDVDLSGSTNYVVMIQDTVKWSYGRVMNVFVSRPISLSELEEKAAETAATIDEFNDGIRVDAQLDRNFIGGMYNTICLPFAVSTSEVARVFGAAKIIGLTSSSIEEGDFVLNLNFDDVTEMVAGTPYLIKPAANISNPKFLGVTIDKTLHNVETDRVDFIGNFVAGTIPAGENNLFLGANDMLYFSPTQDMPILGMRAYFNIHDVSAGAVRRARIVAWENVVTEIEFTLPDDTNTPNSLIQKRVENGQLLIIREGAIYNALGVRIK